MIQIDRHIEILLLDNDCVIVPGLGGFMAHHVPAKYYADTQTFVPPIRQLGFNRQLQINDSLLAQSYIEAYDISYPEAVRRIEEEVGEMKQMLKNTGRCELNDIGTLRTTLDGHLEFEPCEAGILTPELYGLNGVDLKPLAATTEPPQAATTSPIATLTAQPKPEPHLAVAVEKPVVQDEDDDETENEEPTIKIKVSTLKRVATVAAVIVALFVCVMPFGKMSQPELSRSYLDTGILYNILPEALRSPSQNVVKHVVAKPEVAAETIKAEQASDAAAQETQEAKAAEQTSEAPAVEKKQQQDIKTFYTIVLASRITRTNGEVFVKKLHDAGYAKAEVIERTNGAKVIYGRFKTQEEASRFLSNLRSAADAFSDGWIMEVK